MNQLESLKNDWEIAQPNRYLNHYELALQRLLASIEQPKIITADNNVVLACGTGNRSLAIAVGAKYLELVGQGGFQDTMTPLKTHMFDDGELFPNFQKTLQERDTYIITSCSPPEINNQIMELLLIIDAAKRAEAKKITVIAPYLPYQRQDRKTGSGQPVGASLIYNLLMNAGADRIFVLDPHNQASCYAFAGPVNVAFASYVFKKVIEKEIGTQDLIVLGPDSGAHKRADKYSRILGGLQFGSLGKIRNPDGSITTSNALHIDVKGKKILLVDDIAATCGTLTNVATILEQAGAAEIYAAITHGLFLKNGVKRIVDSPIDTIFTTNSIDHRTEVWQAAQSGKIRVVDLSKFLAQVIHHLHTGAPFAEFFHC